MVSCHSVLHMCLYSMPFCFVWGSGRLELKSFEVSSTFSRVLELRFVIQGCRGFGFSV